MRWGEGDIKWIRPLHSILCVFNGSPIKFKIENITTGNKTFGHRFMSKKLITGFIFVSCFKFAIKLNYHIC